VPTRVGPGLACVAVFCVAKHGCDELQGILNYVADKPNVAGGPPGSEVKRRSSGQSWLASATSVV